MTFLLCLATLLLCVLGAKTGLQVISDYRDHWNFSLLDAWRGEDKALTYVAVSISTGACIGLAFLVGSWIVLQAPALVGLEKTVWAMNHFATIASIVGFHLMAKRYLNHISNRNKSDE